MKKKELLYELTIIEDDELSGIDSISLVDDPAISINWVAFKKEEMGYENTLPPYVDEVPTGKTGDTITKSDKQVFKIDDEKKIVLGACMVPDMKIIRRDEFGFPYYVYFSAETIRMISEKYMKYKYIDNNDENHDGDPLKDVYVIESWIKEDENDKSRKYGFEDLPVGTWFVSMKVNNPDTWKKIKNKELNGFSVSGFFEESQKFTKEDMFLYKLAEILSKS